MLAPLAAWRDRLRGALPAKRVEHVGPKLLAALAEAYESVTFVEIGAHDGAHNDPLRSSSSRARGRG